MSKPITVTLPDDLHNELKRFKSRMNISAVCQEAIEKQISEFKRLEAQMNKDPEMNEIIDRLRREKSDVSNTWREVGLKAGLYWSKRATYEELRFMATRVKTNNEIHRDGTAFDPCQEYDDRELHLYNETVGDIEDDPSGEFNDNPELMPPILPWRNDSAFKKEDYNAWDEGLIESIRTFWNEVKDKI